jgi:hypothetical protein
MSVTFWGVADYWLGKYLEIFAKREEAEEMLAECLFDEPEWATELEVVPIKFDFSAN